MARAREVAARRAFPCSSAGRHRARRTRGSANHSGQNYPRGPPPSMRSEERRSCRKHGWEIQSHLRAVFLAKVDTDGVLDD